MVSAELHAPIFLLGSHKSGSSLLRSLLDGHPGLFVYPTETHFFQYNGHWVDYRLRRSLPDRAGLPALSDCLGRYILEHRLQEDPYSDNPGFSGYDEERARAYIGARDPRDWGERFAAYLDGLHFALRGRPLPAGVRIVEKSVENAEYAESLQRLFPDARFVHIVRNPYATLAAIRRAKSRPHYPYLAPLAAALHNSYYHLFRNQSLLARYAVVRYEDLVMSPEETMRALARFLDIAFDEGLLVPTSEGRPWGGNSTSDERFRGVSRAPLENWRRTIAALEIALANRIASPVFERYGYPRLEVGRRWMRPVAGERPRTYLLNRFLLPVWA